jgi:hypothetical protein
MILFVLWLLSLLYQPTAPPDTAGPVEAGNPINRPTAKTPRVIGMRMDLARQI